MTVSITGRCAASPEERNRLFMQYVAPHLDSVRRFVNYLTIPGEDADDNFQEVLITLLYAIEHYDPARAGLSCWLDRVVRNAVITIHRRNGRRDAITTTDELLDITEAEVAAGDDGGGAAVGAKSRLPMPPLAVDVEDYPTTHRALMALPALQRRVLLLSVEGWKAADIAEEFDLQPATVRKMLSRAKAAVGSAVCRRKYSLSCVS